jgi:photosystem II protein PsbQ
MVNYRSVLSVMLAAIAFFLISCSSPTAVAPGPTYSAAQLEQIQTYTAEVKELRERLLTIPPLVQQKRWTDVQSFIHGPLGELRFKMSKLARTLEPKVQATALESAKDVFGHLILIDEATLTQDSRKALLNYNRALEDFDTFLKYIPQDAA